MIPVYLKAHNFLSHIDSEIVFDLLDPITLVIGVKQGDSKKSNGAGKCLCGDTLITSTIGEQYSIKEVVEQRLPLDIFSIDDTGKICTSRIIEWYNSGPKIVYEVTTASGRKIRCTNNHPLLTYDGSKPLQDLQVNDIIAVPRMLPVRSKETMPIDEAVLLSYLLSEGSNYKSTRTFTNSEKVIVDECDLILNMLGAELISYRDDITYSIRNRQDLRGKHSTLFKMWLKKVGLTNKTALTKNIPNALMASIDEAVASFLGRYLSCDGTVCSTCNKWEIGYTSSSEKMIRQIQSLLLRFGILFRLSVRSSQYNGKKLKHNTYYLYANSKQELLKFYSSIGPYIVGEKTSRLQSMFQDLQDKKGNTNVDILPLESRNDINNVIRAKSSWKEMNKNGISGPYYETNTYSREKVQKITKLVPDQFLEEVSNSDILWDKVVSIIEIGVKQTYDIEIDSESHFFVANNIFVHNSAIFDAITWALYEKSRASGNASTNIDSIVRSGAAKAEVEFHFRIGDDLYRVIRTRDKARKKSDLTFQVRGEKKWLSAAADTKKTTNLKIIKTVGLDYDVFVNTVLLEQNDALAFAHMTSGERKDIVTRILPLRHYEEYAKEANKKLALLDQLAVEHDVFMKSHADVEAQKKEAEERLNIVQKSIEAHKQRVIALTKILDNLREEQAKVNAKFLKRQSFLELLENIQGRIEASSVGIQEASERIKRYEVEIKELKDSLTKKRERVLDIKHERGDPGKIKLAFKNFKEKVKQLEEKHKKHSIKVATLTDKADAIQTKWTQIDTMDEGKCPTCYSNITKSSKYQVQTELQEEAKIYNKELFDYRTSYMKIDDALTEAKEGLTKAERAKAAFNKLQEEGRILMEAISTGKDSLIALEQILQDAQSHKKQSDAELVAAQEEKAKILDRIEDLKIDEDHTEYLEDIRNKLLAKNLDLEDVRTCIGTLEGERGGLQERIRSLSKVITEKRQREKDQEASNLERRAYKELVTAFGKAGIQALILENSAVEIEKIANELLSNISDENVSIQIQTQKPNQDGTFKEVFDIIITDEYHSSPFAMYSGGEKFRISFAIRLALSILLTRRAGVKVSAIFYDEAFHDLDEEGADWIMRLFRQLAKDFRHQIVITHDSKLKEQFDDVLIVNKTVEGSTIVKK